MSISCIADEISDVAKTCEEKVEEAFVLVDKQCLSKQDILDIIYSITEQENNDASDQFDNQM
jgi:hypothetical protein